MKTLYINSLILICFLYPLYGQKTLSITASLSKTTYLVGEPVELLVEHKNESSAIIKKNYTPDVDVRITNGKIERFQPNYSSLDFSAAHRDYLPGENTFYYIDLCQDFGKRLFKGGVAGYFEPGKYTIVVKYGIRGRKLNKKDIHFTVVGPTGAELTFFNSAREIVSDKMNKATVEELVNLHGKYPNSVYSPIILDIIVSCYLFTCPDKYKANKYRYEIVEKYSWAAVAQGMISGVLKEKHSKEDRVALLKKITTNCKGHSIEKIYKEQLQKVLQE